MAEGRPAAQREPVWPGGRRLLAEAMGTFALTFVAAGSDTAARLTGGEVTPLARAIAPGLLVMAFIYGLGDASGAHFNPAVSLAFTLRHLFKTRWLGAYWLVQSGGALAAGLLLRVLFGSVAAAGVDTPTVGAPTAVVLEILFTTILVIVVLGTADRYQVVGPDAALAVGATIALLGLIGLPLEGASMNPARSLGPALAMGDLGDLWIYILGPLLGGIVAVGLAYLIHGPGPAMAGARRAAEGEAEGGAAHG